MSDGFVRYELGGDGIATITWDAPGRPVNVLNADSIAAFGGAVRRALDDDAVRGVIVASTKSDFIVGADLERIFDDATAVADVTAMHALLRSMEAGGKPFVAALEGSALGGGLEIALACHHRIGTVAPRARLGFPEVTLGLLPGAGGTQRLPRLIGIAKALPLLLEGRRVGFDEAFELGVLGAVVPAGGAVAAARAWLLDSPVATQPWDAKGYRVPGGEVQSQHVSDLFGAASATVRKKTYGNYPAPRAILSCVFEGLQLTIDAGLRVEQRYFIELLRGPEAKAMVRTMFFSLGAANKLSGRPAGIPPAKIQTVGVLGAGMMGAGIASVTAKAGARVVLIDRDAELAERGRARTEDDAVRGRIVATAEYDGLANADLIIEAVFEDRAIKADVTWRAEDVLPERAIFASNTSTLPISSLAAASRRPAQFIGIHFFSPVEKMPLVEIIRGDVTSDATLAAALDYVRMIGKTPIVVNDSRGFFTSRVFATYLNEGLALLRDGVAPALIENAGRMAGMAVGPLAVADEVSLSLSHHVRLQTEADLGAAYVAGPADEVIDRFVTEFDRPGKRAGKGLYDYPPVGRKTLWPGLAQHFPPAAHQPDVEEVKQRLLYVQSLEAARAYADGVIASAADGDVASILGWGFPAYTGGVFSLIEHDPAAFATACEHLAAAHGERFHPSAIVHELARTGKRFADLDRAVPRVAVTRA
jgi:3-hydroxyacyl-CoA dehydrogenase / enoyl-CoA hydratase / 3-hydroxybutyryl-CoA epimerase